MTLAGADEGGSGLSATYYTLDGAEHEYHGPFAVSGDGAHEITWWSADAAGNVETTHTGYVNIWGTVSGDGRQRRRDHRPRTTAGARAVCSR